MTYVRYRYYQPADGRFLARGAPQLEQTAFREVYAGVIPGADDESAEDLLDRLVCRHTAPSRPEGRRYRPAGTGDVLDLGDLGAWLVLPHGFHAVPRERVRTDT